MASSSKYRRVLLKLSGEALMGGGDYGIDPTVVDRIASEVAQVSALGTEICLVVGGGNIFRGGKRRGRWYGAGIGRLYGHACDGH